MPKHISHLRNTRSRKPARQNVPLLKELIAFQEADGRSMSDISYSAGYGESTFSREIRRGEHQPSLRLVIDMGEILGYELKWVKK